MKSKHCKLLSLAVVAIFALTHTAYADGLSDASLCMGMGGYVGMETGNNSLTLKFNNNAHMDWNTLNLNPNETLNFNAVDGATGLTVSNTITGGQMSHIYGTITSNSGISHLIISNPSGLMFDGAHFTTAGDLTLTTQPVISLWTVPYDPNDPLGGDDTPIFDGIDYEGYATEPVTIKNSSFNVGGGDFKVRAPRINISDSNINTQRLQLITRNGVDFLLNDYNSMTVQPGVTMKAVSVNGNVLIVSGEDLVKITQGSYIDGNLSIYSQGGVNLNYDNASSNSMLEVAGSIIVENTGNLQDDSKVRLRNVNAKEDLYIRNDNGNVVLRDVEIGDRYNEGSLISAGRGYNSDSESIILQGQNNINGSFHLNASGNVIIGDNSQQVIPGNLNVQDGLYIKTFNGNVLFKDDTNANLISVDSAKNILTMAGDGSQNGETAKLTANTYGFFTNNGYTGAIENPSALPHIMHGAPITNSVKGYMNIAGGTLMGHGSNGSEVRIKSHDDLTVSSYNTGYMYLTAVSDTDPLGSNITINPNVTASGIVIGGETKNLTVPLNERQYDLKFTNIRDTELTAIARDEAITYEDFNAPGGYNYGIQTEYNTRVTAPTMQDMVSRIPLNRLSSSVTKSPMSKKKQ